MFRAAENQEDMAEEGEKDILSNGLTGKDALVGISVAGGAAYVVGALKKAKELGIEYFATTLTLSPLKNVEWLNEIGEKLADRYGLTYLYSDFKKQGGYLRSLELSKEYDLYRQDFCGCRFSKR
jgi:hypothetical protein